MREIKFRAWSEKDKKMFKPMSLELIYQDCEALYPNDFIWLQFTGLLDKNGKEIYEGDIVGEERVYHFLEREGWEPEKGNWKIIGEKSKNFTGKGEEKYIAGYELKAVEWKDESCGFEPFSDSNENCGHCGGGRNPNDFEVIGNIYENPDLLTQAQLG